MRLIITIIVIILCAFCFYQAEGQCTSIFGNNNPACYVKSVNGLWMPFYATDDTNKVIGVDAEGKFVLRTKSSGIPIDTSFFLLKTDTSRNNIIPTYFYLDSINELNVKYDDTGTRLATVYDLDTSISGIDFPSHTLQEVTTAGNTTNRTIFVNDTKINDTIIVSKIIVNGLADGGTPDAAIKIDRALTGNSGNAGHAFRDNTAFSRPNTNGYNSFDAAPIILKGSTNDVYHAVGFQYRPLIQMDTNSDTLFYAYGTIGIPILHTGTIKHNWGSEVRDIIDMGFGGQVLYNSAYHAQELTKGIRTNFAFESIGKTKSSLGGTLQIGYKEHELPTSNPFFSNNDTSCTGIRISGDTAMGKYPFILFRYGFSNSSPTLKSEFTIATDQRRMYFTPNYTLNSSVLYEFWRVGTRIGGFHDSGLSVVASGNTNYTTSNIGFSSTDSTYLRIIRDGFTMAIKPHSLSANREIRWPDATGTVALKSDIPSANSFVQINGNTLGSAFTAGTNDNNAFGWRTNNAVRGWFTNSGNLRIVGGSALNKATFSGDDAGSGDGIEITVQNTTSQPVAISGYRALDSVANIYAKYRVSNFQDFSFGLGVGGIMETNGAGFYFSKVRNNGSILTLAALDTTRFTLFPNSNGIFSIDNTFSIGTGGTIIKYNGVTPQANEILVGNGSDMQLTTVEDLAVGLNETIITGNTTITPSNLFTFRLVDATSGNITITVNSGLKQMVEIKRVDNSLNTVTVVGTTGLIDYQASVTIPPADLISIPNVLPTMTLIKGTTNYYIR